MGTLAWILWRYYTGTERNIDEWSLAYRERVLTTAMLYWLPRAVLSASRVYWESPFAGARYASSGKVTVPTGYAKEQYRIIGKLGGEPPFTGTLIHKGWKTEFVKLPRIVETRQLPTIAPAEVELR